MKKILLSTLILTTSSLAAAPMILPKPVQLTEQNGHLLFNDSLSISYQGDCYEQAEFFATELRAATGWKIPVAESKRATISIELNEWPSEKGYALQVGPDGVRIIAGTADNLFYGFQTMRQLCPPEVFDRDGKTVASEWKLPAVRVIDAPRFAWRGVLVDVSRHFQPVDEMLRLLDSMALSKLNVLHWHLTDDQGWRVEIKAYPRLTEVSKQFYTQVELKKIVAYAQQRGITIVPEIDVPGHSSAAVRAYPFLGTKDDKGKVARVINPASPQTYEFLDTVFKEMVEIFPSPKYHIGADEVGMGAWKKNAECQALMKKEKMKSPHELHNYFVGRTMDILKKHGKQAMAWDEAYHGDKTPDGLIISSWRGVEPGHAAVKAGHPVVFCPVSSLYYDRMNSRSKDNPKGYSSNTVTLNQSYFFEPRSPLLPMDAKQRVLGAQGCVWGERIKGGDHLQRQVMMRGAALGESLWSPRESLDWEDFMIRLEAQRARLSAMEIPVWWEPETTARKLSEWETKPGRNTIEISLEGKVERKGLHEAMFHYKSGAGTFTVLKVELHADGKVVAEDAHPHVVTVDPRRPDQFYLLNLEAYDSSKKYSLRVMYEGGSEGCKAVAMWLPALPEQGYSKFADPATKANVSGQKQPDE